MPAKKRNVEGTDGIAPSKPKKGKKPKPYKMPPPLPKGEIFTALDKSQWKTDVSVGKGGFGEIYSTVPVSGKHKGDFVMKVEPFENGPLFSELAFYQRVAKEEKIMCGDTYISLLVSSWKKTSGLDYLAVPRYVASGNHQHQTTKYRFMIMDRYGDDVEKLFCECRRRFEIKTVCTLALRLLEALEFIHSEEYVHADIKGSNLLLGYKHPEQVYLVDYGLAQRYTSDGKHRSYDEDKRRAHDGTVEFTSRDAHKGVRPSRRGDLEILGYCLVQWASGTLPWMGRLDDCDYVAQEKTKAMANLKDFLKKCFGSDHPPKCLLKYWEMIKGLGYDDKPKYEELRVIFIDELKSNGMKDDNKNLDWHATKKGKTSKKGKSPVASKKSPTPVLKIKPIQIKEVAAEDLKLAEPRVNPGRKVSSTKMKGKKSSGAKPVKTSKVLPSAQSPPTERRLRKRQPVSYVEEDTPPKRH